MLDHLVEHLDALDEVADELTRVGVGEAALEAQLAELAGIVQEQAEQPEVAVDDGVERRRAGRRLRAG